MRNLTTFCRIALLSLSFSASAQVIVTPNTFTSTEGGTFGVGRYPFTPSIFQLEVNPSQLGLAVGTEITGIAFRMDHGVNVPAPGAPAPISSFEITLGQAATTATTMSKTFANNFASSTLVRSGPLTIPQDAFPLHSTPNNFGPVISFDTPFTYQGGGLVIQVQSTGSSTFVPEVDADATQPGGGGEYLISYTAILDNTDPLATTGNYASAPIIQLTVVPEPATWALVSAISLGAFGFVRRSKTV